jgi:hypothetical protein
MRERFSSLTRRRIGAPSSLWSATVATARRAASGSTDKSGAYLNRANLCYGSLPKADRANSNACTALWLEIVDRAAVYLPSENADRPCAPHPYSTNCLWRSGQQQVTVR